MRISGHFAVLTAAVVLAAPLVSTTNAAAEHKNLQVLSKDISKDELKKTMEGFTEQLGVKCTFCHILDQYEKDERPHKADARRMIKLVMDMKAKKADYFGPKVKEAVITCGICHRGKAEPDPFVP